MWLLQRYALCCCSLLEHTEECLLLCRVHFAIDDAWRAHRQKALPQLQADREGAQQQCLPPTATYARA